jgi:hypothetical protein
MTSGAPEVADVFRRYGEVYRQQHGESLSTAQRRAMSAIELCRTSALGGHVERCDTCDHQRIAYNSCRNRNCPKCQSLARAQWLADRQAELLDTQYFHVVFTVPDEIAVIAFQNKQAVYDILFRAASETLRTIAADPAHLGAEIGFFGVLHTWGQNLLHHPHLHFLVPGGGISLDGERWVACRPGFFLPVRVLSRLFRGLFLHYLEKAFDAGELNFFSSLLALQERASFLRHLAPARKSEWVVYAKPPFAGPQQVLNYVGRYTHRIAISNSRLVNIDDGCVRFRWKDYRHGNHHGTMTLTADELIRRFLIHVLPDGFQRIRYYGFLANCQRDSKLARCRALLGMARIDTTPSPPAVPGDYRDLYQTLTGTSLMLCPACGHGNMLVIDVLAPIEKRRWSCDTS